MSVSLTQENPLLGTWKLISASAINRPLAELFYGKIGGF